MVHLILEDGRGLWRSTVVMSGVYHLIANAITDDHGKFKRGLPLECRQEFHRAVEIARDRLLVEVEAGRIPPHAVEPFDTLVRMKQSMDRGESPLSLSDDEDVQQFSGIMCDLDEIWQE